MRNGLHTIRGVFNWSIGANDATTDPIRLLLDNGDFRKNFIVESFNCFPTGMNGITHNLWAQSGTVCVLATRFNGAIANTDRVGQIRGAGANDNRQIAWSLFDSTAQVDYIDPEHLIVEDLFINAWIIDHGVGVHYLPNQEISYVIKLRQVKTPIEQAILALVKERAQDDIPGD